MKKLLVFTENHVFGGGNKYMIDLVNAIYNNYHSIVIASNHQGIVEKDLSRLKCDVINKNIFFLSGWHFNKFFQKKNQFVSYVIYLISICIEPLFFFLNILIFILWIRRYKPSKIISCNGGYPASQASLALIVAAKLSNISAILSIVSMPVPRRKFFYLYDKFVDKLVWSSVNMVIVNAQAIKHSLLCLREISTKKIEVILNGVEDINQNFIDKHDKTKFVIGCISRIDVSKGIILLFEAFVHLAKIHDNIYLFLVGRGDASKELEKRSAELNLKERIKLLGHYDGDVHKLMTELDLYVLPSLWEGLPYSIIEAMCAAKTIVATKVGGISEIISDGIEGILINENSKEEIINAIEKLMFDRDLCKKLAINARKKFEQKLTIQHMNIRIKEIFADNC